MQVTAWKNTVSHVTGKKYGLRVTYADRKAFFHMTPRWKSVQVDVEGTFYQFRLLAGFWRRCPEIRDDDAQTLRNWLERHRSLIWERRKPQRVLLEHLGGDRFRLRS